jgi:uncharacterized membrane protein
MFSTTHLHPMLVHFPIALVTIGFLAEIAQLFCKKEQTFSKIGFYLLLAGTLTAIVTLLSGVLFTAEMSGAAGEIQETHELFAWITVGLLAVTSVLRLMLAKQEQPNASLQRLALGIYALAVVSVSITGFYGGTLVYNYMMPL